MDVIPKNQLATATVLNALPASIGILGGTFDPVQLAHIAIARHALDSKLVDAIVIIPAKKNPLKSEPPTVSDADRLLMLSAALTEIPRAYISTIELDNPNPNSYTVDTIEALRVMKPVSQFRFIIGSDQISHLHRWHRIHELIELLSGILVFPRQQKIADLLHDQYDNFSAAELQKIKELPLELNLQEVSATQVRELVKTNQSLSTVVPAVVANLIAEKKLYR